MRLDRRAVLALVLVAGLVAACRGKASPPGPPADRAFYYWRTTFDLTAAEREALRRLTVTRLYLRVFDVGWQAERNGPATLGVVARGDDAELPAGVEVVPVVYLENDVFTHLTAEREGELARFVWHEVRQRLAAFAVTPRELQLDCDWTDSTRDRYFGFLTALDGVVRGDQVALSATLRLHQIKYRERTGVPPVRRGMLMFYNMGRFSPDPDERAIFDARAARPYLGRLRDYPLPLDASLPIWSWVVWARDEQIEGLLQSTDPDELAGLDFVRRLDDTRFQVTRNAFLHGSLLRAGDLLKIEVTGPTETRLAARMLAPRLPATTTPRTIALFALSERNLARHGLDELDSVFRSIR